MWAAPEMNPTGRASSVKEEEQQHCKPIVLQHHSQIISKTRPQSQRPEIHIHSTCTMNAQTHVRGRQNIVLSDRTGTAEDDNCVKHAKLADASSLVRTAQFPFHFLACELVIV